MLEFYEPGAAIIEDSVAKTVARVEQGKRALPEFHVWRAKGNA